MFRGGARNITLPPLHGIGDVIGLLLLLLALFCLASWLWGGSPLQVLGKLLNPPALATIIELQLVLSGLSDDAREELHCRLPAKEKASPSAALAIAERTAEELVELRDRWVLGGLRAAQVREQLSLSAWEAGYQKAQERQSLGSEGILVTVLALVIGRSLRLPKTIDADGLSHVLKGLGLLDPRHMAACAVVCLRSASAANQQASAVFPQLVAI
jgi:hypothetical protein